MLEKILKKQELSEEIAQRLAARHIYDRALTIARKGKSLSVFKMNDPVLQIAKIQPYDSIHYFSQEESTGDKPVLLGEALCVSIKQLQNKTLYTFIFNEGEGFDETNFDHEPRYEISISGDEKLSNSLHQLQSRVDNSKKPIEIDDKNIVGSNGYQEEKEEWFMRKESLEYERTQRYQRGLPQQITSMSLEDQEPEVEKIRSTRKVSPKKSYTSKTLKPVPSQLQPNVKPAQLGETRNLEDKIKTKQEYTTQTITDDPQPVRSQEHYEALVKRLKGKGYLL